MQEGFLRRQRAAFVEQCVNRGDLKVMVSAAIMSFMMFS